ncbi:hypothetical protein [Roseateles sp.]|uniref:hypothetical protein n=1 Tax=Roseateles sp. TaxID=1971397 RepID=UPI0025E22842|nr:hypothetical protein [Roseateles sp.]MBV8033923.1 hypothetical protein [Roseateles sp.]
MRHPLSTLAIGLVGSVFFGGIAVISNTIGRNETTNVWTTSLFLFFFVWSSALVAEYLVARHRLTPEGLYYVPLLNRCGYVRWSNLTSVDYAPVMKWFRLRTADGRTIRLSVMLMGLPEFARHVLAYVPAERMDPGTIALLRQTAAGYPPSVWN